MPQPWPSLVFRLALLLRWVARRSGRGGGGTLPGRVALALHPGALTTLTSQREVALVCGTNGKSTTTALLAAALGWRGPVTTNADGANLPRGLVSTLLADRRRRTAAVLEVDELYLGVTMDQTRPRVVVLLNLSRDQLDRVEEVSSHVDRWAAALRRHPDTWVVANADDPLVVAAVRSGREGDDRIRWVAAGAPWLGDVRLCPRCARHWAPEAQPWRCAACGLARPDAAWTVDEDARLHADDTSVVLQLRIPGRAGRANAVMAVAAADLLEVPVQEAADRLAAVTDVDGRYQDFALGDRHVRLLLGKNPAGWIEVLADLGRSDGQVLIGINAQIADGIDPSWLWDVPFEELAGRDVVAFGQRGLDLSVRLTYAGVEHRLADSLGQALDGLTSSACLAANYTAFTAARKELGARARCSSSPS